VIVFFAGLLVVLLGPGRRDLAREEGG